MAGDTIKVCDHLVDFDVIGQRGEVGACGCHLADAVVFTSPCMVVFEQGPARICGVNRTFPAIPAQPKG